MVKTMKYVIKSNQYLGNLVDQVERFIKAIEAYCFPNYYEEVLLPLDKYLKQKEDEIVNILMVMLKTLNYQNYNDIIRNFTNELNNVLVIIKEDVVAFKKGDPSCLNIKEIILAYPTFKAIFIYRFAHVLYQNKVHIIPRLMNEYAHRISGVDINSGAKIGSGFFIDHGTGVVIGETSVIGKNVRIYQGVTLGASSLSKGSKLKGTKRHPTIKNNVIIYANSAILGGDTVIGNNVIIGANCFLTHSVCDNQIVKNTLTNNIFEKK